MTLRLRSGTGNAFLADERRFKDADERRSFICVNLQFEFICDYLRESNRHKFHEELELHVPRKKDEAGATHTLRKKTKQELHPSQERDD